MKKKKIVIPHEHGGWAMVSVPFLLGMCLGNPTWLHLPLFLGWFLLYLATYPFLQSLKKRNEDRFYLLKWAVGYSLGAFVFITPLLFYFPELIWFGLIFTALFAVNIWHVKQKKERAMLNDLSAILSFSIGGAAAYFFGKSAWNEALIFITLYNSLYFIASAFFVKTVFRERKNLRWLVTTKIAHGIIAAVPILFGHFAMVLPFIYAVVRTFVYGGKKLVPMKVGIIEIVGAVQFLLLTLLLFPSILQ